MSDPMSEAVERLRQRLVSHAADLRRAEFDEDDEAASLIEEAIAALAAQGERSPDAGEVERLRKQIINTPETADFMAGVPLEAAHQRDRWGEDHDAGKAPFDWFWLIGYLAAKAAASAVVGDVEKAKHHTISTGAALANWHAALSGADNRMRPGIEPPAALQSPNQADDRSAGAGSADLHGDRSTEGV